MPALGGSGACPPKEILKITPSETKSEGIFSHLSTFDVPVDTGTENFLKCIICMPIYPCWVTLQKLVYFKIVMLLPLKLLMQAS